MNGNFNDEDEDDDEAQVFNSFFEFIGMENGRVSEDSFYQAIAGFEQNNRERLNVSDMMKWL